MVAMETEGIHGNMNPIVPFNQTYQLWVMSEVGLCSVK